MSFYKIGVGISKLAVLGRMGSGGGFCFTGLSFDAKRRLGDDEEVRDHFWLNKKRKKRRCTNLIRLLFNCLVCS